MTTQNKFTQNKGKEIVNKAKSEEWYEEGVIMNRDEFLNWLFQKKERNNYGAIK